MKNNNSLRNLVQNLARTILPFGLRRRLFAFRVTTPPARPEQLPLDLDELTDTGLALREAIPVRSAEYWMELGYPELAMEELEHLSLRASQHPWPRRIRQQATLAVPDLNFHPCLSVAQIGNVPRPTRRTLRLHKSVCRIRFYERHGRRG